MLHRGAGLKAVPSTAAIAFALAAAIMAGLVAVAAGLFDPSPEETAVLEAVRAIADESSTVAENYFAGPESVAQVVANGVQRDPTLSSHVDLLRDLTISQPNLDGAFVGYPDGSFVDVRRDGGDQLRIKTIEIFGSQRSVNTDIVNSGGEVIESFPSLDDTYDPRTRPWFEGARVDDQHWTEPYVFFTSQLPGVTHSVAVTTDVGAVVAVVGVDIRLENLETFLDARRPSENGGAALLTSTGQLIAGQTPLALGAVDHELLDDWIADGRPSDGIVRTPGDESRLISITEVGADGDRLFVVDAPQADFLGEVRANREDLALLSSILGFVALSLMICSGVAMRRYVQKLDRLVRTDSLTGLMNRVALYDELGALLEGSAPVTVMMIDVDSFKLVNDRYGHRCGDHTLGVVADRLLRTAPRDALVARLGGDEFCVAITNHEDPVKACEATISDASGTIFIDGHSFDLKLSAGYVMSDEPGTELSQLLHQADLAMYAAKSESGSAAIGFVSEMADCCLSDWQRREGSHPVPDAERRAA